MPDRSSELASLTRQELDTWMEHANAAHDNVPFSFCPRYQLQCSFKLDLEQHFLAENYKCMETWRWLQLCQYLAGRDKCDHTPIAACHPAAPPTPAVAHSLESRQTPVYAVVLLPPPSSSSPKQQQQYTTSSSSKQPQSSSCKSEQTASASLSHRAALPCPATRRM